MWCMTVPHPLSLDRRSSGPLSLGAYGGWQATLDTVIHSLCGTRLWLGNTDPRPWLPTCSLWYGLHAVHPGAIIGKYASYAPYILNWAGTKPHLHECSGLSCKHGKNCNWVIDCSVYPFLDMSLKWTASTEWHVDPLNHSAGITFCKKLRQTSQNLAKRKLALV